jgi:lipopolysaccharide biosynthesis regulator YciM
LGLIHRKQTDWHTAVELTENLKKFDKNDPVKYDFALFGLGIEEKF